MTMRKISLILVFIILVSSVSFASGHRYVTGTVQTVTSKGIVVNDLLFKIKPGTYYTLQYKDNGRYLQKIIKFSYIRSGQKVRLKAVGLDLEEIVVVEDY